MDLKSELEAALPGILVWRDSSLYSPKLSIAGEMHDMRPELYASPRTEEEVVKLVKIVGGRASLAVLGGGHSFQGLSCDVAISMKAFNKVEISGNEVSIGAGCVNRDVDDFMAEHGIGVTLGNASTVGVVGALLGGGVGYLARWIGLSIDLLLEARVLLADGSVVVASKDVNSELFWAIRGGGGNFGIVLEVKMRAERFDDWTGKGVGMVFTSQRILPHSKNCFLWCGNKIGNVNVLTKWRDYALEASNCVSVDLFLPTGGPIVQQFTYKGPQKDALLEAKKWKQLGKAAPIPFLTKPKSYHTTIQRDLHETQIAPIIPAPHNYRVAILKEFPDSLAETLCTMVTKNKPNSISIVHCERLGGKILDEPQEGTAFAHRDGQFWISIVGIYSKKGKTPSPEMVKKVDAWLEKLVAAVRPHALTVSGSGIEPYNVFGENLKRLQDAKAKYDPTNIFSAVECGFSGAHSL